VTTVGLFPRTRGRLLAALLLQPERAFYLHELARRLGTRPSSLQAELASLTGQGILRRRRDGRRTYYQAEADCPYLPELQGLLAKTVGVVEVLRLALAPLADRIERALLHGSLARGDADADSDVDLLVVGDLLLEDLAGVLPQAAVRLGRPVNPTLLTPTGFAEQRAAGQAFLRSVLDGPTVQVLGGSDALEGPAGGKAR
jgi:DNA-binding transcriptional ArsR family regulator